MQTERIIELLTLWEKHMASIDDQLKALNAAVAAIEKPADISGLAATVQQIQQAQQAQATVLTALANSVTAVGNKLGTDTFTATGT